MTYQPPPPTGPYPPPYSPGPYQPTPGPSQRPQPKKGLPGWAIGLLILFGFLFLIGIVVFAFVVKAVDSVNDAFDEFEEQEAREQFDFESCTVIDDSAVEIDLTNMSSKQSSYSIVLNYLDDDDRKIADEPFDINHVRPEERLISVLAATVPTDATSCELTQLQRFASVSPDSVFEASCTVTGVDALGNLTTELAVTNDSTLQSNYAIDFAFMRDSTRIGEGTAIVEGVNPGQSALIPGSSVARGPADGVGCEVTYLSRTTS